MTRLGSERLIAVVIAQLVALGCLGVSAVGAGYLATSWLPSRGFVESLAVRLATGIGVLGTILFALGMLGALRRGPVLALVVAMPLAAAVVWRARRGELSGESASGEVTTRRSGRWSWLLLAAVLGPTFVWTVYPPIAFDATAYHLPFARAFARAGRLVVVPHLTFPVLPQLAETLFAGMLVSTGVDLSMHLVQFSALAVTAVLLFAAGNRFYGPRAGVLAAALWLAHPLAHYQGASGYVDLTLTMFCVLAVVAWEVWREDGSHGWMALAGAGAGLAAATKHLGLLWLGLLAAMTLVAAPRGRRLAGAGILVLAAALVGGPWYLRLYRETGNPVYPMLGSLFGGPPTLTDQRIGIAESAPASTLAGALARRPLEMLRKGEPAAFFWKASFDREAFHHQSPFAPWHLVLVPLAAVWAIRDRRLLRWLLLVVGYAALWTTADLRFQLPSAALLALVCAGGLEHYAPRFPALDRAMARPWMLAALAALLLAPGPLYAIYKLARLGEPPPATPAARDAFLMRHQPCYAAVRYLERRFAGHYTLYTFRAPELAFHAHGRVLGQWGGPFRFARLEALAGDGAAFERALAAMGADALLVTDSRLRHSLRAEPEFRGRFRHVLGDADFDLYLLEPRAPRTRTAS